MTERELNAAFVKTRAKELGADLVGIASAATLNAFPPDPRWPQTPERISPYCKSVIVLVQRIPAGAFRCKSNVPVQYIDMLVLRKMDKVAYRLAEELEDAGHPSFVTAAQETDWKLQARELWPAVDAASRRRGRARHARPRSQHPDAGIRSARLSHRHPDRARTRTRPADDRAGLHRRVLQPLPAFLSGRCSAAFRHRQARLRHRSAGVRLLHDPAILRALHRRCRWREKEQLARSRDIFGFWQGLLRVVGSFGDCPRCLAVCPVGNDYHAHLAELQKAIPEKTPEKVALGKRYRDNRDAGRATVAGPQRLEPALGRAGGLPGHGGAAAAGIQESCSSSASRRRWRRPTRTARIRMVAAFKKPLTADEIKAKARALGADLVGIADGADAGTPSARSARSAPALRHHRTRRRPRHRAGQAPQPRRRPHRRLERPAQILQRRARALAAGGSLARAGLLAGGQRLSGDHRAADPCRSVAL